MSDTLYERYIAGDDSSSGISNINWRSQSFTIGNTGTNVTHNITSVKLLMYKTTGTSPGNITVSIRNAVSKTGLPTGADLTTGTTNGNTLPTGAPYEWREITLTPYQLNTSTKYTIVVRSAAGTAWWRYDGSTPSYTGGVGGYSSDGTTWIVLAPDSDFLFYEYGIVVSTTETPEGNLPGDIYKDTTNNYSVEVYIDISSYGNEIREKTRSY